MADGSEQIGQDEIEELLRQAKTAGPAAATENLEPQTASASGHVDRTRKAQPEAGLTQSDIETQLAKEAKSGTTPKSATTPGSQSDIELLFNHAQAALDSVAAEHGSLPPGVKSFSWADFSGTPPSSEAATIDLLRDVELNLKIELGRTSMYLEDVLRLHKGSVVTLDKLAGDPVDIFVNGRLIARGEVLVLNDNFCVRVAELVVGEQTEAT
jgi:flagellar motor switch protein FliN/FliY